MSNLVLLEGFLRQRLKQKEMVEVYAVLTSVYLKIYRSKISYSQNPSSPNRTINFENHYNIIEMPFEKTPMFSLFKRGEKADERLYLEASTKSDYDHWFSQIDGLINKVIESDRVSSKKLEIDAKPLSEIKNLDAVDKSLTPKSVSSRYNIKTSSPLPETKQLQQSYDNIEGELKKKEKTVSDVKQENDELRKKLLDIEKRNLFLENEKKESLARVKDLNNEILRLKSSISKSSENRDKQLEKASKDIVSCLNLSNADFTTYKMMVDHLCELDNNSPFLTSLLRYQLESLVHYIPVDPSSGLSLYKYLTTFMDLSHTSFTKFLSTFFLTLSTQLSSHPSSKCDLNPNVMSLLQSVIEMVPPIQVSSSNKSFQQNSLEVTYLLRRMTLTQDILLNGHSEPLDVNDKFNDLMKSLNIETVTKVFIVELVEHIKESTKKQSESMSLNENAINKQFEVVWESLCSKLKVKEQENNDLLIVIKELGARNTELEATDRILGDWRNMDNIINYYTSFSHKLCSTCQINVVDVLKIPATKMVDKLVEDFISYWRCFNDLSAFLAKKKTINSDVKDALDMTNKLAQRLEALMSQLQEITQRIINNPGCSKALQNSHDL